MFEIEKDSTDRLVFEPPAINSRITGASVRVQTPSTSLPDSGDAATWSSFSDATTAAAGAGAEYIVVSDPSSLEAGDLLLLKPKTHSKQHVFARVDYVDNTSVYLTEPLITDIGSGWVVIGWWAEHDLTASETETAGPCLAVWTITYAGQSAEPATFHQQFRVVKQSQSYRLTPEMLTTLQPIAHRLRPPTDNTLSETINAAWRIHCEPRLRSDGKYPDRIKSWDMVNAWHATACVYHLMLTHSRPGEDVAEWEKLVVDGFARLVGSVGWYYDESDDLGGESYTEQPRHSIKVLR